MKKKSLNCNQNVFRIVWITTKIVNTGKSKESANRMQNIWIFTAIKAVIAGTIFLFLKVLTNHKFER